MGRVNRKPGAPPSVVNDAMRATMRDVKEKLVDELGGNRRTPSNPDEIDTMAAQFERAVAAFREMFPAEWAALKLCPLQHGVEEIAAKLKG